MLLFLAIGLGVVALAHTAPFPFLLDRLAGDRAVWKMPASPSSSLVYLTFDDGPNPTATPALLDVLEREQVRATFFIIDRHLTPGTAPLVRRMFEDGHAVALHSHTRSLMLLRPEQLADELTRAADRIETLAGRRPCPAFRPHAGWRSGSMYEGLDRLGWRLVGWGWNLWDWNWFRRRAAPSIASRIADRASEGDIIVLHDGHHENPQADRRYAVDATTRLIPEIRAKGLEFGLICEPGAAPAP